MECGGSHGAARADAVVTALPAGCEGAGWGQVEELRDPGGEATVRVQRATRGAGWLEGPGGSEA